MICDVCHAGEPAEQLIRYSLFIGERLVIFDHVPAIVCPTCGDKSFRPDVVDAVQRTISAPPVPSRVIEAPVYEFAL